MFSYWIFFFPFCLFVTTQMHHSIRYNMISIVLCLLFFVLFIIIIIHLIFRVMSIPFRAQIRCCNCCLRRGDCRLNWDLIVRFVSDLHQLCDWWPLSLWNSLLQILQLHRPSGGDVNGGVKQYMWYLNYIYSTDIKEQKTKKKKKISLDNCNICMVIKWAYPRSQSSQNSNWSSLSDVPQIEQYLHSMHCHRYRFTDIIMFGVNWRQDGWPERPQSEHDTKSSGTFVFRFSRASPKQKSQYGDGGALFRVSFGLRIMRKRSSSSFGLLNLFKWRKKKHFNFGAFPIGIKQTFFQLVLASDFSQASGIHVDVVVSVEVVVQLEA